MSTLRVMRTFLAVARHGSFSEAAEHVALTQAAVSVQMKSLESELGRELFERHGRLAVLNAAGREVLPEIRHIVECYERLRRPPEPTTLAGSVSIGAIVSCMGALSRIVSQLKQHHPALEVKIVSGKSTELADKVATGQLHAALVAELGNRTEPLTWTSLYEEPLVVLAPASVTASNPRDLLVHHPFLRFDRSERTGLLIARTLRRLQWQVNDFLELNSIETLVELVRRDVGVTLLPQLHGSNWQHDETLQLLPLPVPGQGAARAIGLIERPGQHGDPVTDLIRTRCVATFLAE